MGSIAEASDEELAQYAAAIRKEQARRRTLATTEKQVQELSAAYLSAAGVEPGQEWKQPTSAVDAYPKDWTVTRNDVQYTSQIPNNVWTPGDPNDPQTGRWWKPETTDEAEAANEWAPWIDVAVGETWTYEGTEYKVIQAHQTQTGWEPPNVPALWEKVE